MSNETNTEVQSYTPKTQVNYASLVGAGLGAAKLVAVAFGLYFITDKQIDAVVNAFAVGAIIYGVLKNNFKK